MSRTKLRDAIAGALYPISAYDLAEVCDDLKMPAAAPHSEPMASKIRYVKGRISGLDLAELVSLARAVNVEYPEHEALVQLIAELDGAAGGVPGQLKNIIFAAVGAKPRIVLNDALNNDLVVVDGIDRCLVYDQPLAEDGLTWRALTRWWGKQQDELVTDANERAVALRLFERLRASVANEAEEFILRTYSTLFAQHGFDLPALLPQVYLHYDPYSVTELGERPTLIRQRMDFLMLLPRRVRVVIEVDGRQHYTDGDGKGSPERYAEMVSEDRVLRLAGYEVYRFGGYELSNRAKAGPLLIDYFTTLLARHNVLGPG
jgi:hypothetical protein